MYNIQLEDFEGPLDLLLFFIKRDELDIYNIPISRITREFLDYMHYLESLDLEVAAEFLVMAAELMQIKAKMLLPPEPSDSEEADPRLNLVTRLVEYKRYKEKAVELQQFESQRMLLYTRKDFDGDERTKYEQDDTESLKDVTILDLIQSFKHAIETMPRKFVHEVNRLNVTIDEMILYLTQIFQDREETTFQEITTDFQEKLRIIVTFIALLELVKAGQYKINQKKPFETLRIRKQIGEPILV